MPRTHIIQSWVGACEFDEGDTYSGEQIGNRNQKSIGLLVERSGDQWKAGNVSQDIPTFINGRPNIQAFAEPIVKPKAAAKKKSVLNSILLADRNYERLCGLSEQLDQEFDAGQIDLESWAAARKNIDQRLAKAWARVQRERGWEGQEELLALEQYPSEGLEFTLDIEHSRALRIDYSVLPSDSVFSKLSDDNLFKIGYTMALTVVNKVSKLWNVSKTIIEEGLL